MTVRQEVGRRTVVHVFGAMDRGGAELRTIEVAEALPASTVRMIYVTLSGREGELADVIRKRGDDVVVFRLTPRSAFAFAKMLKRRRIDAVHSHVATFSGVPLLIALSVGVPVRIAHFRSDGDQHRRTWRRRIQRRVMRAAIDISATHIIGVSPGALTFGWRPGWEKNPRCRVIANGIAVVGLPDATGRQEIRRRLGASEHVRVLCHVGKSDGNKNRELAVRIACALSAEGGEIALWLVGPISDAERKQLCEIAQAARVREAINILGTRADVRHLLNAADVTLVTSRQEGLPGVVLESLAVGTVVTASDLPGCRWISDALPGVRLVDVAAPLEEWVDCVRTSIGVGLRGETRSALRAAFVNGPFQLQKSVDSLSRIWLSAPSTVGTGQSEVER